MYEVFLRLLRGIIGLGTSEAVHSCISSSCKAIDKKRLRTVLKVSYTELPLKVEAPRVKVAVGAQCHRVLRSTSHLFELQGVLLGGPCWLQYLKHVRVVGLLLKLADSELSISVGPTRDNF